MFCFFLSFPTGLAIHCRAELLVSFLFIFLLEIFTTCFKSCFACIHFFKEFVKSFYKLSHNKTTFNGWTKRRTPGQRITGHDMDTGVCLRMEPRGWAIQHAVSLYSSEDGLANRDWAVKSRRLVIWGRWGWTYWTERLNCMDFFFRSVCVACERPGFVL